MNILRQSPEGGGSGGEAPEKQENLISMSQEQFDEVIASRLSRQEKKIKEGHRRFAAPDPDGAVLVPTRDPGTGGVDV